MNAQNFSRTTCRADEHPAELARAPTADLFVVSGVYGAASGNPIRRSKD